MMESREIIKELYIDSYDGYDLEETIFRIYLMYPTTMYHWSIDGKLLVEKSPFKPFNIPEVKHVKRIFHLDYFDYYYENLLYHINLKFRNFFVSYSHFIPLGENVFQNIPLHSHPIYVLIAEEIKNVLKRFVISSDGNIVYPFQVNIAKNLLK